MGLIFIIPIPILHIAQYYNTHEYGIFILTLLSTAIIKYASVYLIAVSWNKKCCVMPEYVGWVWFMQMDVEWVNSKYTAPYIMRIDYQENKPYLCGTQEDNVSDRH